MLGPSTETVGRNMNGVVLTLVSRTEATKGPSEAELLREQLEAERGARLEAERKLIAKSGELAALTASARKSAEDNRSTVRFLNAVMDSMPAGLCLTDIQGNLRMANPPAREMLNILSEAGCELYGCQLAMEMMGLEKKDLIPQVKDVITAGDFYDLAEGAQIIFT